MAREKREAEREKAGSGKGAGSSPAESSNSPAAAGGSPPGEGGTTGAGAGEEPPRTEVFACTDLGNAERLAHQHGTDLRWCEAWGTWLAWDGARWTRDDTGEVIRRAALTVRAIGAEAAACEDSRARKDLWTHALKSESARALSNMVTLARAQPGMAARPSDFDSDPMLLNCRNGVIDLRTGELRPHRREDLCIRSTGVGYDPAARSDTWEKFLRENLDGDAEVIAELQRFAGYCLTGITREDALYFLSGGGGSGKSTFIESLRHAFGTYADTINFDMLLKQPHGRRELSPELASLPGVRFVVAIESDRGREFDTGYIKKLTGGDALQAEAKYQAPFSYVPQFKLCLATNYDPGADPDDSGFWRRIRRVIFPRSRPLGAARNTSIRAELTDAKRSGAAVLAWAVQGCLAWQRDGLKVSAKVEASLLAYQRANDPLAQFIADRAEIDKAATESRAAMRAAYEAWAKANDAESLGARRFAELLREKLREKHGPDHRTDSKGRVKGYEGAVDIWRGVKLLGAQELAVKASKEDRESREEAAREEAVKRAGSGPCSDIVVSSGPILPKPPHARSSKGGFGENGSNLTTNSLHATEGTETTVIP